MGTVGLRNLWTVTLLFINVKIAQTRCIIYLFQIIRGLWYNQLWRDYARTVLRAFRQANSGLARVRDETTLKSGSPCRS